MSAELSYDSRVELGQWSVKAGVRNSGEWCIDRYGFEAPVIDTGNDWRRVLEDSIWCADRVLCETHREVGPPRTYPVR